MSKTVKQAIMRDYKNRLGGDAGEFGDAMIISVRGLKARDNTTMRLGLAKQKIKVTVVRNALARKSISGTHMEKLSDLLTGPSAIVYGGASIVEVARAIVKLVEKFPTIELKGAILDGMLYSGKKGVEELSKFPTKDEAIAKAVTLIVSPGRNLLGQLKGPVSSVAGLVKAVETRLEKGEEIKKVG